MNECNCEPCGPLCNCTCHDAKNDYQEDGGTDSTPLIGDSQPVSRDLF